MNVMQGAKWVGGLAAAGLILLLLSIFVADRQLEPPFEEAELQPVEVPSGTPVAAGAVFFSADDTGTYEIYVRLQAGGTPLALTNDPTTDSWRPRLSPDRQTLLFYRSPAGVLDTDLSQASLWMIAASGGEPVEILPPRSHGWTKQGGAEWSPLGSELVMMGERPLGMQVWVTTIDGRDVRNLVNDLGDSTDPSWSPDAKRVMFAACPIEEELCAQSAREIFVVLATGGERIQITNDELVDEQPRFSPDGRQIVMRSQIVAAGADGQGAVWDLRVVPTNRSTEPMRIVGDGSISGSPVWSDDQTVVFHRFEPGRPDSGIFSARVSDAVVVELIDGAANELFPGT